MLGAALCCVGFVASNLAPQWLLLAIGGIILNGTVKANTLGKKMNIYDPVATREMAQMGDFELPNLEAEGSELDRVQLL